MSLAISLTIVFFSAQESSATRIFFLPRVFFLLAWNPIINVHLMRSTINVVLDFHLPQCNWSLVNFCMFNISVLVRIGVRVSFIIVVVVVAADSLKEEEKLRSKFPPEMNLWFSLLHLSKFEGGDRNDAVTAGEIRRWRIWQISCILMAIFRS